MIDEKFIESFEVSDWEIETEDGWKDITHSNKTKKFVVWKLNTESFELKCADNHIVMDEYFSQIFVKDLKIGKKIFTKNGLEKVISVECLNFEEEMYDLSVDSENHTYFTSGILSHNTTMTAIYIIHYAIFNENKTIAILANKERTALEIMQKIKQIYENIPFWLQVGLEKSGSGWSKSRIEFANESRILAASTASTGIRGFTINLLFLDEFSYVASGIAEDFMASVYPTISSGTSSKIIIVSTPNGMNHFYNIWSDAVKGKNQYYPIKINWFDHPDRDEKFKERVIKDIGITRWMSEYSCGKFDSLVNIKDKETGIIKTVTVEELYKYGKTLFN